MSSARPTLRRSIEALPPAAWVLFAGTFINRFGSFVLVFLVLYLTREGYSIPQAGLAISAYGIGSLISAPVGGYLADRLGRRNTIALSMFASAAAMLALSQAATLSSIAALSGIAGFAAELYRPASSALLADLTQLGERVSPFAMYRLAINLGAAAGPAVGGFMAERSFMLLFVGDALTSIVFGVVALVALPRGARAAPRKEERAGGGTRAMLADRAFVLFLVGSFVAAFVYFQANSTFALQVTAHGFPSAVYGGLISLNGILVLLLELPISGVTQRLRPRPVIALGFLLVGIGFGLVAIADSLLALGATVVVWTLGEIIASPVAGAYVADAAPAHMRGRYQGAWGVSFGLALVLGPGLGTVVFSLSPLGLWVGCLVLGAVSAALVLAGGSSGREARIVE